MHARNEKILVMIVIQHALIFHLAGQLVRFIDPPRILPQYRSQPRCIHRNTTYSTVFCKGLVADAEDLVLATNPQSYVMLPRQNSLAP